MTRRDLPTFGLDARARTLAGARFVHQEIVLWNPIIKAIGLKLE
jgi:hypothetical protein